jgi:excisionase family DNA binding protein
MDSSTTSAGNPQNFNDRIAPNSSTAAMDYERDDGGFEPLLDVSEAAKLLRIHPKTLRVKARRGVIPAIQIGRVWRFRASALNRWLDEITS